MTESWTASMLANLVGGVLTSSAVAGVAFWRARVPDLSGVWTMNVHVQKTDYNPYRGMKLTYIVMLSQSGGQLSGVAEKVHEVSKLNPDPGYHYQKSGRMHSAVSGGIFGNLFQKKKFQLIINEAGKERSYISTLELRVEHKDTFKGSYVSTASNASGTVTLTRGIGRYGFSSGFKI